MSDNIKKMRPIWYFVGWLLFLIGIIVTTTGLYGLNNRLPKESALDHLHPDIWWGAILLVAGFVFIMFNRKLSVE